MTIKRKTKKPPLQPSLPSAEWLAEMIHQVFNGFSEEEQQRRLAFVNLRREEALLYVAREVLEYYDAAVVALQARLGAVVDPLRHEDVFTPAEIAGGVHIGTKTERGWANIVTEQICIYRAKKKLVKWIDWLIYQTKQDCVHPAKRPHYIQKPEVYGGFGGCESGKHWIAACENLQMPMQVHRVMRIKRDFGWYELLAAQEAKWAKAEKKLQKKPLTVVGDRKLAKGGR